MAGSVRREGGSESVSAWVDVARGQPDASNSISVSLPRSQYRHPTDIDQSVASTTRTIASTLGNGTNARPAPRTCDDIARQQRRGGGNAVAMRQGTGEGGLDGNWVTRTTGEGGEHNSFTQRHEIAGGQGGAGMEDPRLPTPIGGQTSGRTVLDRGAGNGTGTFDAGKGGKVKKNVNFVWSRRKPCDRIGFPIDRYKTGYGEGSFIVGRCLFVLFQSWTTFYLTIFRRLADGAQPQQHGAACHRSKGQLAPGEVRPEMHDF